MDGVGVKSDENVLSAGGRRLVLRLVRPDEDPEPLLDLFEKAHHINPVGCALGVEGWQRTASMSGPETAINHRLRGVRRSGLAPPPTLVEIYLSPFRPNDARLCVDDRPVCAAYALHSINLPSFLNLVIRRSGP
jgi:hypothetical protein